jgi:hypothetical protein
LLETAFAGNSAAPLFFPRLAQNGALPGQQKAFVMFTTLFKPRETCFLIGTKSVSLGIRPSNLAYGTSFARGKTGTALPKRSNLGHLKNVIKERML